MKRLTWLAVAAALAGCPAHTQLNATTGDSQKAMTLMATPFTDAIVADPCAATGTGLGTVRITTSSAYAALALVTLGIVQLVDVEYSCAPQTGGIPAPLPDPG